MEFNFRAVDDPPPPPMIFPSFSQPPFPSPSPTPGHSFTPISHFSNTLSCLPSIGGGGGDFRHNMSPMCNPYNAGDIVMRNLMKERIREEIMMGEIALRRELEAEVRQEIVFLEREMAMRRAAMTGVFAFGDSFAPMRCNARPHLPRPVHPFHDQLVPMQSSASPRPQFGPSLIGGPVSLPVAPPPENFTAKFKVYSEPNKDKLIVLAKPDPNLCRTKSNAVVLPTSDPNELHPFGLKKKPKEEWSCALCQVSASCEKTLNDHLQGKKHMAKEAKLKSQNAGKNPNNAPVTMKTGGSTANSKLETEVEGKTPGQNESASVSNKKKGGVRDLKLEDVLPTQKDKYAVDLRNRAGSETMVQAGGDEPVEQTADTKFKVWCEMCQVGTLSSQVMEDHKKGKKHLAKLLVYKSKNDNEAASKTTQISSEAVVPKPEDTDAVAATIPKPETSGIAYEPIKSDKAALEAINISSRASVPDPNVVHGSNKINEDALGGISLKSVTIPKPEDPDVALDPNKSNEASSRSTSAHRRQLFRSGKTQMWRIKANSKTAIADVKNLDNPGRLPEADC